jgi:hypothetical protein
MRHDHFIPGLCSALLQCCSGTARHEARHAPWTVDYSATDWQHGRYWRATLHGMHCCACIPANFTAAPCCRALPLLLLLPAGFTHHGWVVPCGVDVLLVWRDLDALAG